MFLKLISHLTSSSFFFKGFIPLRSVYIVICFSITSFLCLGQDSIEVTGGVAFSTFFNESTQPFWITSNSGGFIGADTNVALRADLFAEYYISKNHRLELGIGGFYRDDVTQEFQRNNLYLNYRNNLISATLGSKEINDRYQGLGVVGNNFIQSGNARALPGIKIELSKPKKIFKNFFLDAAIAHYTLNDDRFVENTLVHNKKLDIIWELKANHKLNIGIEHFAQWGGNSPLTGEQPDGLGDFINVFFASGGDEDVSATDQFNAVGNSLGYYKIDYHINKEEYSYRLYHEHPFEDGSGTGLRNFPDGLWGFYYESEQSTKDLFVKEFLLEYVSTLNQSGSTGRSGRDNYFNNGVYRSGWTYEGNTIGLPFITVPDNNRIQAFHAGINFEYSKLRSSFKSTYLKSLGTFVTEFEPARQQILLLSRTAYQISPASSIQLDVGYDFSNAGTNNLGAGLSYIFRL